jgi:hypothetical protein
MVGGWGTKCGGFAGAAGQCGIRVIGRGPFGWPEFNAWVRVDPSGDGRKNRNLHNGGTELSHPSLPPSPPNPPNPPQSESAVDAQPVPVRNLFMYGPVDHSCSAGSPKNIGQFKTFIFFF